MDTFSVPCLVSGIEVFDIIYVWRTSYDSDRYSSGQSASNTVCVKTDYSCLELGGLNQPLTVCMKTDYSCLELGGVESASNTVCVKTDCSCLELGGLNWLDNASAVVQSLCLACQSCIHISGNVRFPKGQVCHSK